MEKITLENGVRVCLEYQDYSRTACFGVWAGSGPAYETPAQNGISHFIEHMLFKGTEKRTALDIAEEMDFIGGQLNAYTAKDYTCFYARTLEEHVPQAFDILGDMITSPRLDKKDIDTERGVVIEEIGMSEDTPDELVSEKLYASVWKDSPFGRPILGTEETLNRMTGDGLRAYMREKYAPNRLVIAICGRYDRQKFLDVVSKYFAGIPAGGAIMEHENIGYEQSFVITPKEQEQTHIDLCLPSIGIMDDRRYPMSVLNIVLGGSSSSRLFQRIREQMGLAYSIYSTGVGYNGGGVLEVQAAVAPEMAEAATLEMVTVLNELKGGVTEREFTRAKQQLKAGILMSMESISSRAGNMGRGELIKNRVKSEEEIIAEIEAVTREQVNTFAGEVLDTGKLSVSVVGPVKNQEFYRGIVLKH